MIFKKIKKYIPNILTISRIILTPIIMETFLTNNFLLTLVLTAYSMTTDFFDGYLSRKWNVTSKLGALLDQIADKILGIGALLLSIQFVPILIINLILEGIISSINIISKINGNNPQTLFSGKVKTWSLFITLVSSIATKFIPQLSSISIILSIITSVLQTKACCDYYHNYNKQKQIKNKINSKLSENKNDNNCEKIYNNTKTKNINNDIKFLQNIKDFLNNEAESKTKNKTKIK